MATKTIDYLEKMVTLAHYEHEGFEYDTLHLSVMYRKGRGFFVSYQPVKRNGFGGFETGQLPSDDPLVGGKTLLAENADKNNAKRLQQMMANLEAGTEAVVWLFDHREWDKLNIAIVRLARDGYTESYQKQMHDLMAETGGSEKKDESPMMRQFNDFKKKYPNTMLLFRCGDFYETYGDDAKEAAKILGITLTWRTPQKRHAPGDYTDAMAGFPHHALNTYLPKLVRAGKRVAICDQLEDPKLAKKLVKRGITELVSPATNNDDHELNELNETNQTSTTMEPKNNNQNESANVQDAQVNDNVTTEADVAEVDDIVPVVTKKKVAEAMVQAANGGPATTMPLGQHGTLIIAGGGDEPRRKSGNNGKAAPTTTEEPKITLKRKTPQPSAISHQPSTLPVLTFAIYKTDDGNEIPQIVGFGGEDDPRWKKRYDERLRLNAAAAEAKKKNEKLREQIKAACKGKTKEEKVAIKERMMKKWVHTTSDPFGARLFTDRLTGEKKYYFSMGTKYADVARELCDAYNSGDADAIAQAEQAVIDRRASINAGYEAQREERKAAKDQPSAVSPQTSNGYSAQDVAAMLKKVLAGGALPKDVEALMKAA